MSRIGKKPITIPAGVDDGQNVVLSGQGDAGRNGGSYGDVYVEVSIKKHSIFQREGRNIYCDVPITFSEAVLGATIDVPTLEGKVNYSIPEGTQTGTVFKLKGKGITEIRSTRRGDLIFRVVVEVPKNLNKQQKELLKAFADSCGEKNNVQKKSFFDKLSDLFS